MRPFQQLPFADLPPLPRRPHPYDHTRVESVTVHSVPFGTHSVHVRSYGEGPPLLLIHGLMTSSYSWRYMLEPLGQHFHVIAPDLIGHGRTDAPDGSYRLEAVSPWLGELQRALGVRGAPAVANSLGGTLALHRLVRDPGAFAKLSVVHSPVCPSPRLHALHAALRIPGVARGLRGWIRRAPERFAHRNVHYYDESLKSLEEASTYGGPLRAPGHRRAFVGWLGHALAPRGLRDLLRSLAAAPPRAPIQLVYATTDPLVPPATAHRLAQLFPAARLDRIDRASHFAHIDAADRFAPLVLDFLRS